MSVIHDLFHKAQEEEYFLKHLVRLLSWYQNQEKYKKRENYRPISSILFRQFPPYYLDHKMS